MSIYPKNLEISSFEQLLKYKLRVFPSLGGKFNFVGLDHSGSQPFIIAAASNSLDLLSEDFSELLQRKLVIELGDPGGGMPVSIRLFKEPPSLGALTTLDLQSNKRKKFV